MKYVATVIIEVEGKKSPSLKTLREYLLDSVSLDLNTEEVGIPEKYEIMGIQINWDSLVMVQE